jgi:hypothetical protein
MGFVAEMLTKPISIMVGSHRPSARSKARAATHDRPA